VAARTPTVAFIPSPLQPNAIIGGGRKQAPRDGVEGRRAMIV